MTTPQRTRRRARSGRRPRADIVAFRRSYTQRRGGQYGHVQLLGLETREPEELLERVDAGLTYHTLERFRRNVEMSLDEVAELVQITKRTLNRRKEEGRLNRQESDRLVRASRVVGRALELFEGDVEAARKWMAAPAVALGNRTPEEVATTDLGAREVESLIGRLEHGVPS